MRKAQETDVMSRARAAGILGALILCGLLSLASLAVASGDPANSRYYAMFQGVFFRACFAEAALEQPSFATTPPDFRARVAFFQACVFIVRTLRPLMPSQLLNATFGEEVAEAALDAMTQTALHRRMTCDACVQAVADLLAILSTNGTATGIEAAFAQGCEERFFFSSARADQCLLFAVSPIFELVDGVVSNLFPVTTCQELKFCPVP